MKRIIITLWVLIFNITAFAQPATKKHVVKRGETITQIAKKYNTSNNVLFLLNPEAVKGISRSQVLQVPITSEVQHRVQPKETVYGISKQYEISIEELYKLNPGLEEYGLKVGQILNITGADSFKNTIIVQQGETIYGIATKNNTTVSELYEINPELRVGSLREGQVIKLPIVEEFELKNGQNGALVNQEVETIIVKPKETIFNITRTNNVTQQDLLKWNPKLRDGLKEGDTLIVGFIQTAVPIQAEATIVEANHEQSLVNTNENLIKELVFLLPFNLASNNLSNPSIHRNIQSNAFLNMTLEFYSGAQLAISELEKKNYPLNIRFVDSKETNRAMDVESLKNDFNFSSTDVIIGPFFQKNVDAVSDAFKNQSTLIVSPLSTSEGKPYPRQIHAMPSNDIVKKEMMNYLKLKKQNVVAITDEIKTTRSYFNINLPSAKVMTVGKNEKVSVSNLKALLNNTEVNYIVYDARSLTTSIELIRTLKGLLTEYKIHLVGLEKNDVLESSDISTEDLIALNYTFPSVTNDSENLIRSHFQSKYLKTYGKRPTRFATRGYDVTFDVIARMFRSNQDSNIFDTTTQQVENKFSYSNENGGVYNRAVFILYYDKDYTIKEAK